MRNHRADLMRAGALAVVLALAGCSATPNETTTPIQTSAAPIATASTEGECAPPAALTWTDGSLPDGDQFGWVRHFDGHAIYFDPAEYFRNEDAVRAARKDGHIGDSEDLPNPIYIRDPTADVVRILVSDTFTLTVIDAAKYPAERALGRAELARIYCGQADTTWMYALPGQLPAHVHISAGHTDSGTEQYLP